MRKKFHDSHEKNNKSNLKKFDESNRTYQNNTQRWNDQSNLSNNPISLLMVCFLKKMKRHLLEMMDGLDLWIALLKRYQHLHQHHPHKSCLITSINSANWNVSHKSEVIYLLIDWLDIYMGFPLIRGSW